MAMSKSQVKELQRKLNHFTNSYLAGIEPLRVDGSRGPATRRRTKFVKYYLGFIKENRTGKNAYTIPEHFYYNLGHPKSLRHSYPTRVARGIKRRIAQRKRYHDNLIHSSTATGVGYFDGKPVALAAIPILKWCRANGWHGRLNSGWRDPKYSEHLCYNMCGRPACPGLCAGASSNHSGSTPSKFAIDVSDYVTFRRVVARCPLKPHIWNNLPRDPVHFSPSGN